MKNYTFCMWNYLGVLLTVCVLLLSACSDDDSSNKELISAPCEGTITDDDFRKKMKEESKRVTWSDTVIICGPVYVEDGEVLTIREGTIVKGRARPEGKTASALIVARGGKVIANGTKEKPIIFTYEADPLDGSTLPSVRGRWGGVIILGRARLNSAAGETSIEGIPTTEPRGIYGGDNDEDNSGELRYVSIRHGGAVIGADNEINGLTLGGVGSSTTLEYIEIIGNKDDGIEFFGGTANVRYLISAYNQDDAVDYDEGYRGLCQFVIIHQDKSAQAADRAFECDGGTKPENGTPLARPIFVNVTVVGNPYSRVASIRDNAGGFFYNTLFTGSGKGVDIEKAEGTDHSYQRLIDDDLIFRSNAFGVEGGSTLATAYKITEGENSSEADEAALDKLKDKNNTVDLSITFKEKSATPSATTDFPSAYTVPSTELTNYNNNGYQQVDYIGAVDPSTTTEWYASWSFYATGVLKK